MLPVIIDTNNKILLSDINFNTNLWSRLAQLDLHQKKPMAGT